MRKAFDSPEFEESLNDKAKGSIYLFSCFDNNFLSYEVLQIKCISFLLSNILREKVQKLYQNLLNELNKSIL